MNSIGALAFHVRKSLNAATLRAAIPLSRSYADDRVPSDDQNEVEDTENDLKYITVPQYKPKNANETLLAKRARLTWQSRKRGIAENCILLSTFVDKYLNDLDEKHVALYDILINTCNNDWDLYYWMTGVKPVPEEFNNKIMEMLKVHCRNDDKTERFKQPALKYEPVEKLTL